LVNKDISKFLLDDEHLAHLSSSEIREWIDNYPYVPALRYLLVKKETLERLNSPNSLTQAALVYQKGNFLGTILNAREISIEQNKLLEYLKVNETNRTDLHEINHDQVEIELVVDPQVSMDNPMVEDIIDTSHLSNYSKWLLQLKHVETLGIHPKATTPEGKSKLDRLDVAEHQHMEENDSNKVIDESNELNAQIASESLANLFSEQGYSERAIAMYEKLSLINSEKRAYFAAQIEKIKGK